MMRKALVVEDESNTGELLGECLRRRGFEPTVLTQGKSAIAWTREHHPDLILLDVMLPDLDGYRVCEDLKLDRPTSPIPIIMISARDQHADKVHGLRVGANFYLLKPFTLEQLDHAIEHVLAWHQNLKEDGAQGEIHFTLQSETQYLEELNHLLAALYLYSGLSQSHVQQLTLALREMGVNAIEWGHQNQTERILRVTYRIDPEKATIGVRDTGPGFDPDNLPHAATIEDPDRHMVVRETLGLRAGGFGILLARGLVDDLQYNESGNEVRMVKYYVRPA
jgi:two-component system OmpR family response regulator